MTSCDQNITRCLDQEVAAPKHSPKTFIQSKRNRLLRGTVDASFELRLTGASRDGCPVPVEVLVVYPNSLPFFLPSQVVSKILSINRITESHSYCFSICPSTNISKNKGNCPTTKAIVSLKSDKRCGVLPIQNKLFEKHFSRRNMADPYHPCMVYLPAFGVIFLWHM